MLPDLERIIALQTIESAIQKAERRLTDAPELDRALDARLDTARQRVADAKQLLADNQAARRAIEKDVAVHQGRLSKFREQAMAVKTNQEYHAVQKEIEFAQTEIKALEDRILERMLESDELTSAAKRAESELAAEQKAVDADRKALVAERDALRTSQQRLAGERTAIVSAMDAGVLALFELVAKRRNGIGVAEAKDGICTICHVRLRPQIFNSILRNEDIIQCDSCNRIMYFRPAAPAAETPPATP